MKNAKKQNGLRLALKSEQLKVLGAEDLQAIAGGATAPPCEAFTCLHTRAN
jgi:hypothetical protein